MRHKGILSDQLAASSKEKIIKLNPACDFGA